MKTFAAAVLHPGLWFQLATSQELLKNVTMQVVQTRTVRRIYFFFCLGMLFAGLGMAVFFSLPFATARHLADSMMRDGSLESLTKERFEALKFLRFAGAGGILLAIIAWLARSPGTIWMERLLRYFWAEWLAFWTDSRAFFAAWRAEQQNRIAWALTGGLTLLSALNKVFLLSKPMGHDESYTFVAFASLPIFDFIRDYHLPNNHIFHSILVHLSYQMFGDDTWAVRLPAFLGGVLLVPAAFLAGRRLFNQPAGLLAAGLVAVLPVLRDYSSSARGYTLLLLFTFCLVYLGSRTLKEKNRLVWLLWVIAAALGLYTIPIMLYPFAMVTAWMGLAWLAGDADLAYRGRYWLFLFVGGLSAASLTLLLYLPVFIYSGVDSLTANSFVQPLTWVEFSGNLGHRFSLAWREWHGSLPVWLTYLLEAGFGIGVIFSHRLSRHKVPLTLGLVTGTGAVLLVQRVAPEARVWLFAVTAYLLTTSGGLVGAAQWLGKRLGLNQNWARLGMASIFLALVVWSSVQSYSGYQRVHQENQAGTEMSVLYLSRAIGPNDVIVPNMDEGPAVWYYARRYGIPEAHIFNTRDKDFNYAWILVSPGYGQDLDSVLAATNEIDTANLDLSTAELIHQESNMDIYRVKQK
jgi:hypothetical protein